MLGTFGMQQGGSQYRRIVASFQRIFGATMFFGTVSANVPRSFIALVSTS
jgi:hypothetical protein